MDCKDHQISRKVLLGSIPTLLPERKDKRTLAQRKKFLRKTQTKKLLKNYCKNSNKLPYPIITQGKLQRLNKRPGKTSENEQGLASFKHRYPVEKFGII